MKYNSEIWKLIWDFPDYKVSNFGRVKRFVVDSGNRRLKILKPASYSNGYLFVTLTKNRCKIIKQKMIHRLVLEAFVKKCPEGKETNHKDGIKDNNYLTNLEWLTTKENQRHMWETGLNKHYGENHSMSKLKVGEVWLIKKLLYHNVILQKTIAKMFLVGPMCISTIKRGETWKRVKYER